MNTDLVDDALADAALHPEHHDQGTFYREDECGTRYCLAAFILLRAGGVLTVHDHIRWEAQQAARLTDEQADFLFIDSAADTLKELQERWSYLKAHPGDFDAEWRPPGQLERQRAEAEALIRHQVQTAREQLRSARQAGIIPA